MTKTVSHTCTRPRWNGKPCRRTFGPYYDITYLKDAVAQHLAVQHVNTLDYEAKGNDRAGRRAMSASMKHPPYERPSW